MTTRRTLVTLTIAAIAAFILSPDLARAQEPQLLGEYEDWAAYTYDSDKGKVCYIVSQPKDSEPKDVRRDPIFMLITHRPGEKVHNEVSTIIGYPFKKGSTASATIGGSTFQMFTSGDGAWLDSKAKDREMVNAMKRGIDLVIKGTSWRGTVTTDKYSLRGVTAAMGKIDQECP